METPRISAIAAISSQNRALGYNNQLLWHLPADLSRFKSLTSGCPIIMGRKTYDSIIDYLGKPLPNRTSIVLSRGENIEQTGVITCNSIENALKQAWSLNPKEIFIGGGQAIYELALPYTDRLYLTLVEDEPAADSFFPAYEKTFTKIILEEKTIGNPDYSFVTLEK